MKYIEEQIIGISRKHQAGAKTAELRRRHSMPEATFQAWKAKFGGKDAVDAKRRKALEEESAELKRFLAEAMPDQARTRHPPGEDLTELSEVSVPAFPARRPSAVASRSWAAEHRPPKS